MYDYGYESISDDHDPRESEEFQVVYESLSNSKTASEQDSEDALELLRADSAPFVPTKETAPDLTDF